MLYLNKYPAGFHFDEVNAGYNIYLLLKTGETLQNGPWPLYLNTFGDYRLMGSVYTMLPTIKLLGLTEVAVRLPLAIVGSLSIPLIFVLAKMVTKNFQVAFLSAVFLCFSPWHIVFSRATAEGIFAIFISLVLFVVYFSLENSPKISKAILLYVILIISFFSYHPLNLFLLIFIPLVTGIFFITDRKNANFTKLILVVYLAYLVFPFAHSIKFGHSTARFNQVSFLNEVNQNVQKQLSEVKTNVPIVVTRTFNNKALSAVSRIGQNYSSYFSIDYLLLKGGPPDRYKVPNTGLLTILEIIGLGVAIMLLAQNLKKRPYWFFFLWLMLAPLAASITTDDNPNVHRTIIMLPALIILSSLGITSAYSLINKKTVFAKYIFAIFVLLYFLHVGYFFEKYSLHEKYYESYSRNYAARDIALNLAKIDSNKRILVTTQLLSTDLYTMFFQKIDPSIAINAYKDKKTGDATFLNYEFTSKFDCPSRADAQTLKYDIYVDMFYCDTPAKWKQEMFYQADGITPAAKIVERIK